MLSFLTDRSELRLAIQQSLSEAAPVSITIPESFGLLLPANGLLGTGAGTGAVARSTSDTQGLAISGIFSGSAMGRVEVENVDYVAPAIVDSALSFTNPRSGEDSGVLLNMSLGAASQLLSGDVILVSMEDFSRNITHAPKDIVTSVPANSIKSAAAWSTKTMQLALTLQASIKSSLTVSLSKEYGLRLPVLGVTSDTAHRYNFQILRGGLKLLGKTTFSKVQRVASVLQALMTFGPIPEAGANVEISIKVTLSCPLPSGAMIKWRLPGFQGVSFQRIFINSLPVGDLAEASYLSDDGSGAGILSVQVGSSALAAYQGLEFLVPKSAGIRLPVGGTPSCKEGDECTITIECHSPTTGVLLPTTFRGSNLVGIATNSTVHLTPRKVKTAVEITFSFWLSFDLRVDDALTISLSNFEISTDLDINPGGLCPEIDGAVGPKCFKVATITSISDRSAPKLSIQTIVNTNVTRGKMVTFVVPATAGIMIFDRGLPRTQWNDRQASSDISVMSFQIERRVANRYFTILPTRRFSNVETFVGSFYPLTFSIEPRQPGVSIAISISLTLQMKLFQGENIIIDLPGFLRKKAGSDAPPNPDVLDVFVLTGTGKDAAKRSSTKAPWNTLNSRILIQIRNSTDPGTQMTIEIEQNQGIILPPNGLTSCPLCPKISCDAYDGFIDQMPLPFAAIDPFLMQSRMAYQPPRAGTISQLSISVITKLNLQIDDTIRFTLSNFTGGLWCWDSYEFIKERCILEAGGTAAESAKCISCSRTQLIGQACSKGCNSDNVGSEISFEEDFCNSKRKGCFVRIRVAVSPSTEIEGARTGACDCISVSKPLLSKIWNEIIANDKVPRINLPEAYGSSCNAWDLSPSFRTGGPSCAQLWPVTLLPDARVSAVTSDKEAQLGQWCCIPWCFVNKSSCLYAVPWAGAESLSISHDTCATDDRTTILQTCPFAPATPREGGGDLAGSWVGSIFSQLSLTSLRPIARGSLLEIVVPSAAGLVLPAGGLPANDRFVTIDGGSSSRMLYMLPVPVEASQPVGLLTGSTRLSFGSGGAAMPSAMLLEFASSGRLQPNEKIYVTLPGFDDSAPRNQTGARTIQVNAATTDSTDIRAECSWHPASYLLTLTVKVVVAKGRRVTVSVLPGQIRLPAAGIRKAAPETQGFRIWIESADAPVPYDPPTYVDQVQAVGAFWYTHLSFNPPLLDTPTSLQIQFVVMMQLDFMDSIQLALPGVAGPIEKNTRIPRPLQVLPSTGSFEVLWSQDAPGDPALVTLKLLKALAPETLCLIRLPATCLFTTTDGRCDDTKRVMVLASDKPAVFTLTTSSAWGPTIPVPIRLVSLVAKSELKGGVFATLRGKWRGDGWLTAGYVVDSNVSARVACMGHATTCPARADYWCYPMKQSTSLEVGAGGLRLITADASLLVPGLLKSFVSSGTSTKADLVSMSSDVMKLINRSSTNAEPFCMRARSLSLVDLDGSFSRAMEIRLWTTFRATGNGEQALRLRFKLISIPKMNPVGIDFTAFEKRDTLYAVLSRICQVPESNLEFVVKGKYLPLSKCFQKEECTFEVRVSSSTAEQKIFAQAWANSIESAIRNETMQYYLSELNIFVKTEVMEQIFLSIQQTTNTECPTDDNQGPADTIISSAAPSFFSTWAASPQSLSQVSKTAQSSAVQGSWLHESALRGVPPVHGLEAAGVNSKASASCVYTQGSHDGDGIVTKDSYSVLYAFSAVLYQTSSETTDLALGFATNRSQVLTGAATRPSINSVLYVYAASTIFLISFLYPSSPYDS